MGRSVLARKLLDYFIDLGRVATPAELNSDKSAPVQVKHIRRAWGTYKRCLRAIEKRYPQEWNDIGKPMVEEPAPKAPSTTVEVDNEDTE